MSPALIALFLGLGSALTLAAANAFVKAGKDILLSRAALSLSAAIMVLPLAFIVPLPNRETWLILAISIPSHWIYQFALIRAMHRGDLSLVFPIMRGSAPLVTALFAAFALGEALPPLAIAGLVIASVATAVFALPEGANAAGIRKAALFWSLATGLSVALYNVVDAFGVRAAPTAYTFIVWLFLLDWIGVNAAALYVRSGEYLSGLRQRLRYGAMAGALSVGSFGMALYGFTIAPVAYISALRETAVVFGALLGWKYLKEGLGLRRTLSALVLAGGLMMLQLGG